MKPEATLLRHCQAGTGADPGQAVKEVLARTTPQEQAALATTLRRGASWDEAMKWLEQVRHDATSLPDEVYQRALALYGDSTVLDWKECVDVAPALTYRPQGLPTQAR
jgi:hypothetical protein